MLLACTPVGEGATAPLDEAIERRCFALAQSPPHLWPRALPAVLADGRVAAEPLSRLLRQSPHAPGAAAVAAALGEVGDARVSAVLVDAVQHADEGVASEAALALGKLQDPNSRAPLAAAMHEPALSPLVRTSAAVALLRLGTDKDALTFLCDMVLAGSSFGRARGLALGLPVDRPRWALERNLAAAGFAQAGLPRDIRFDADAPWPDLNESVDRIRAHFGLR